MLNNKDRIVYKYTFDNATELKLEVPFNSRVVAFQAQRGVPTFWMEHETGTGASMSDRRFVLVGTGHRVVADGKSLEHRGTIQLHDGDLVLHLYEYR